MTYEYEYPRPAVTVDCVVFGVGRAALELLLVERGEEPYAGSWALPGGFVQMDEDLEEAARRELAEETGLERVFLEQLYTFGAPGRDPRGRVISVAHFALVRPDAYELVARTDAKSAQWFPRSKLPPLAFDHDEIIDCATRRLRAKLTYQPIGFELLPNEFTLTELQQLYETVLERPLDKRNFRKKVLSFGLVSETGRVVEGVPHRAPKLYRFDERRYQELEREGFEFQLR